MLMIHERSHPFGSGCPDADYLFHVGRGLREEFGSGVGGQKFGKGTVVPGRMERNAVLGRNRPNRLFGTRGHAHWLRRHADEVAGAVLRVSNPVHAGTRGAGKEVVRRMPGLGHDEVQLHAAEDQHDDEADDATPSKAHGEAFRFQRRGQRRRCE